MTSENIALRFVKKKTRFFNKIAFKTDLVKNCRVFFNGTMAREHILLEQIEKSTCGESQVLVFRSGSQD